MMAMAMTEAEWLGCVKLTPMMTWLRRRRGENRLFYLAGCAAVRQVWDQLPEPSRELILLVERYADGKASRQELGRAHHRAEAEAQDQLQSCQEQGMPMNQAVKVVAAPLAAARAAMPGGGYEAAFSAMQDATQTGKRAEVWARQCGILRHIFGNPFRRVPVPADLPRSVVQLAEALYNGAPCHFALHDALVEAGHLGLAEHFREADHPKGCWVIDMILGLR
jgi:hypothetical protein